MLGQLHFEDHATFQKNTAWWAVSGAAGALVGLVLRGVVGPGYDHIILLAMTGLGIGAASGLLKGSYPGIAVGAVLGALLGGVAAFIAGIGSLGTAAPWLGAAAAGGALGLLWGPERAPRPARAVGFALAAVVGLYVTTALVLSQTPLFSFLGWPAVQDASSGALMGFFLSLGGAVGRVRLDRDPVMGLWAEVKGALDGDLMELSGQGVKLYQEIQERVEKRRGEGRDMEILEEAGRVSRETTQRLLRLARRWSEIEASVDDTMKTRLKARRQALEEKLEGVSDSVIRAEYTAVVATIDEQLQSFGRIDIARERLVARMHRCLASLERVSLRVLQLSTSDAQDASLSLQPELERLDEMSDELSWKTLSVDDLCAEEPTLATPAQSAQATAAQATAAPATAAPETLPAPVEPVTLPAPASEAAEAAEAVTLPASISEVAEPVQAVEQDEVVTREVAG